MSVFRDMARDAGTHIDAGISLDEAAALHEANYLDELRRLEAEEYERERAREADIGANLPAGFVDRLDTEGGT